MKKIIGTLAIVGVAYLAVTNININIGGDYTKLLSPYGITKQYGLFGSTYNIRLGEELGGSHSVENVTSTLQAAHSNDTVIFHIVGYGGSVDGVLNIINVVKQSKAHIVMSVEGPSYSAYAVLATQGQELKMSRYSFLMFHTSSLVNYDPTKQGGEDRGVSNKEHMQAYYNANMVVWYKLLAEIKLLNNEEKYSVITGHDVYLMATQVNERLEKGCSKIADNKFRAQEKMAQEIGELIQINKKRFIVKSYIFRVAGV